MIAESRLTATAKALGTLAKSHAETPMAGRTYGQIATPTSFGAIVASWGEPLLRHLDRLAEMRPRLLTVTLAGAAGTLSAMGSEGSKVRAAMAKALDLSDAEDSRHSSRDHIAELSSLCMLVTGSLGKMGEDLTLLTQSGISEVSLSASGSSSTMPQKQNPVAPSVLVALANAANALNTGLQGTLVHRQQRDGGAWLTEWLLLPPDGSDHDEGAGSGGNAEPDNPAEPGYDGRQPRRWPGADPRRGPVVRARRHPPPTDGPSRDQAPCKRGARQRHPPCPTSSRQPIPAPRCQMPARNSALPRIRHVPSPRVLRPSDPIFLS